MNSDRPHPLGLLGGTFDPIHDGHLELAREVRAALALSAVRLLPAGDPPHRAAPVATALQRLAMVELAIEDCPGLEVDAREIARPGRSYTVLTLEESLPPVMFDPAQFQQVAVNLIVNAAESFCGKAGEVQVLLGWHQERIRLRVIDHGCGMDQSTIARIFDPYFTTKDHGHGLGLAAVKGIIAGVSGSITCESVVGSGTTFTVLLTPCVSADVRKTETSRRNSTDTVQFALVTDDDELVREITVETLTGLGYTCLQATGGQECLRILHEDRARICLLVLDCRMPDIDGVTVLKRIRDQGDRLPVVLISGMINVDSMSPLLRDRKTKFLAKPFSQNQLAATIDTVFGSELLSQHDRDSSRTAIMVADVIRQRNEENNRRESGSSRYRKERNN